MNVSTAKRIGSHNIIELMSTNAHELTTGFLELQSDYLTRRYSLHKNIDMAQIQLCLCNTTHLEIVRQREHNLDYNLSLHNFFRNIKNVEIPTKKIVDVVHITGLPKETVRRKIHKLVKNNWIEVAAGKKYKWKLPDFEQENFLNIMKLDIKDIAKFISLFTKKLHLEFSSKEIENELSDKFSFYFLHYTHAQLNWYRMWQSKVKDIDLIFISIQALIPNTRNKIKKKDKINIQDLNFLIGSPSSNNQTNCSINASSISTVSGIPRATCMRKLDKLVDMGMLIREMKSKRYFVNPQQNSRVKHILQASNISTTIEIFSEFLSIVINAMKVKKNFY